MTAHSAHSAAIPPVVFGAMEGKEESGGGGYSAPLFFLKGRRNDELNEAAARLQEKTTPIAPRILRWIGGMESSP
jgi:hypothetical protein